MIKKNMHKFSKPNKKSNKEFERMFNSQKKIKIKNHSMKLKI